MNALRIEDFKFSFPPLPAGFSPLPGDDADDDWAEFLALGRPADPSDLDAGARWARTPVLLSF